MSSLTVRALVVALALSPFGVGQLMAQTCVGAASFSEAPVRLGAGFGLADGTRTLGAEVAAGSGGFFAAASVQRVDVEFLNDDGTAYSLTAGYSIPLGGPRWFELCPLASYSHQTSPDFEFGFDDFSFSGKISGSTYGLGGALGIAIAMNERWQLVPFAGAMYKEARMKLSLDGRSQRDTVTFTMLTVGSGFMLDRRLTIQPRVSYPFGVDEPKATYGLSISWNFGRRAR
jgi:hypothetical protein